MKFFLVSILLARLSLCMSMDRSPTGSGIESSEDVFLSLTNSSESESVEELESASIQPDANRSHEPKILSLLQKVFSLATKTGDLEAVQLVIGVEKLQPLFHEGLLSAIKGKFEDIAMLIAAHPGYHHGSNDNFKAAKLAVAKKMSHKLVVQLVLACQDPKIEDAVMGCISKGLVDVLSYLAPHYKHSGELAVARNGAVTVDSFSRERMLVKFLTAAIKGAAPLETLPIILADKSKFTLKVSKDHIVCCLQDYVIQAHKDDKIPVRNLLIERALSIYRSSKNQIAKDTIYKGVLVKILDKIEAFQNMMAADTGFESLPNDLKRDMFSTMIDSIIADDDDIQKRRKAQMRRMMMANRVKR